MAISLAPELGRLRQEWLPRLQAILVELRPVLRKARYAGYKLLRALRRRAGESGVPDDPTSAIRTGFIVIVVFFGVLGGWAALASIAGAAIAPDTFKVEGNRQSVQHRYGGTVAEILVNDGDRAEQGQVLLRLDDTTARAKLDSQTAMRDALKASEARLIAERDGASEPAFDQSLTSRMYEPNVAAALANQLALFRTRAQQFASETDILHRRIAQLREQIEGSKVQAQSAERQQGLIEEELKGVRSLYERGYSPKSKLLALKRAAEELAGTSGAKRAEIAKAEQGIGETEIEVKHLAEKRLNEVTDELRDTQSKLVELEPQLADSRDVVERTELRAPVSGTVVGMTIFTEGGVITPGARVVDIVPTGGDLVVEAHVRPEDVHDVAQGAPAEIRLTGMLGRLKPSLAGRVTTVSADRFEDSKTGNSYYATEVRIDVASVAAAGVILQAGMPADVLITTKERSVLDYLLSPLSDQIARGFRED